jgi:hypothetical protein
MSRGAGRHADAVRCLGAAGKAGVRAAPRACAGCQTSYGDVGEPLTGWRGARRARPRDAPGASARHERATRDGAAEIVEVLQTGFPLVRQKHVHQIRHAFLDARLGPAGCGPSALASGPVNLDLPGDLRRSKAGILDVTWQNGSSSPALCETRCGAHASSRRRLSDSGSAADHRGIRLLAWTRIRSSGAPSALASGFAPD